MAGILTVDTIQSDSSYASTLNVASKINFTAGMQIGGQDTTFGGMRNRIINGNMVVDQRNVGNSQTFSSDGVYGIDRWQMYGYPYNASSTTMQQVSPPTALSGFTSCMKVTSTGANTLNSLSYTSVCQQIEGLNTIDLAWGTASAKPVTLSFWVYSSLTGTFGGSLQNSVRSRSYPFTYTISSANTWEQKTIIIPGCTDGAWVVTSGVGIQVGFQTGVGATYSGTATGSWQNANYWGATGATNMITTNGATFYLTGVQLEKGSAASAFEQLHYGHILALCQRYFSKSFGQGTAPSNGSSGTTFSTYTGIYSSPLYRPGGGGTPPTANDTTTPPSQFGSPILFPVIMRVTPSVTLYGNSSSQWFGQGAGNTSGSWSAPALYNISDRCFQAGTSWISVDSAGAMYGHWTAQAEL
jgi:hypothetical protein